VTHKLFADDAYNATCDVKVVSINDLGGIILDQTVFYATSGGQPGDSGFLECADGSKIEIATTVYEQGSKEVIVHVPAQGSKTPDIGEKLIAHIDWERRYNLMRMHSACHLLSVVCPLPITGASVSETDSRPVGSAKKNWTLIQTW